VLLDQDHEVLDLGLGDVGEGEGLDIAGAAGGGMGDGAAVLQRAGKGSTGADFDGSVFDRANTSIATCTRRLAIARASARCLGAS